MIGRRLTSRLHRRPSRRAAAVLAAVAAVTVSVPAISLAASGNGAAGAFTASKTITRTEVNNGASTVVDKRKFSVRVSQTQNLRDRQEIQVNWSGAHPTGGITPLTTTGLSALQEYPVVLMMCRGTSKTVSPQTCWTETPDERALSTSSTNFPPYRVDQYATAADRGPSVGVPSPSPKSCSSQTSGVQHWVPFVAASGKVYHSAPGGCDGIAPEQVVTDSAQYNADQNTVYGVSNRAGRGSSRFIITTNETNASLGCSDKDACSLVVLPIEGISCDPAGFGLPPQDQPPSQQAEQQAAAQCESKGQFAPGSDNASPYSNVDPVAGNLWWSASNWRNRITVPLSFAPPDDLCQLISDSAPQNVYGSPLVTQAATQWSPYFCTDPNKPTIQQIITSEPEAKNLLVANSIDAAFQAAPPSTTFANPTVEAPTALTGFAIAFDVDNAKGQPVTTLRLDARLVAKLLTESYPGNPTAKNDYASGNVTGSSAAENKVMGNNPIDIAQDPEFQALNPGLPQTLFNTEPASTLLDLSSDSDVTTALTSWINSDPEARAWLNGKADPWGMQVNPNYKNIQLPVTNFPQLDASEPQDLYKPDINHCLADDPVPWLPLIASPLESQAIVTLDLQFGIADSQVQCSDPGATDEKLVSLGTEQPGRRFILGVTSLGDAARYKLDTASLETQGGSADTKTFSVSGRSFAAPSAATLRAAARMLKPDPTLGTWVLPYAQLRTAADGKNAYPGTMLVSTDIPVKGLASDVAQGYGQFLAFIASRGQQPGFGNGDLPPGYLPMTAGNGMAAEVAYTQLAAAQVSDQTGLVPTLHGTLTSQPGTGKKRTPPATPGGPVTPGGTPGGPNSGYSGGGPPVGTTGSGGSGPTGPSSSTTPPGKGSTPTTRTSTAPPQSLGRTAAVSIGGGANALPLSAGVVLLAFILGAGFWSLGRRQAR